MGMFYYKTQAPKEEETLIWVNYVKYIFKIYIHTIKIFFNEVKYYIIDVIVVAMLTNGLSKDIWMRYLIINTLVAKT